VVPVEEAEVAEAAEAATEEAVEEAAIEEVAAEEVAQEAEGALQEEATENEANSFPHSPIRILLHPDKLLKWTLLIEIILISINYIDLMLIYFNNYY
jgi:hypothetical protein